MAIQQLQSQKEFLLSITAEKVESSDDSFTINNLSLGDFYKPLEAYFEKANGEKVTRFFNKKERKISNKTLPLIAFQIFEKQIESLSVEDKDDFPICKYKSDDKMIKGIFPSIETFRKYHNSLEFLCYPNKTNCKFVIYCWNIFSPIFFVQECLKRFGDSGDKFILKYYKKNEQNSSIEKNGVIQKESVKVNEEYRNEYSSMLIASHNLIFRGAPGTGKTYLAKKIAADIISDGAIDDYSRLSDDQKKQVEFVQLHPNFDYVDFVEGLRPKINDDGSMGFELQDGIFKKFVTRARKNYENSQKSKETIEKELSAKEELETFFSSINFGKDIFTTITGNEFTITNVDETHINIFIPNNATTKKLTLNLDELRRMLESRQNFTQIKDITNFFGKAFATQGYSYDFAIYKAIRARKSTALKKNIKQETLKKYIFIIDEINRGDISKIFGELFFAIDPGYRGRSGEISTQYSNMHSDPDEKFYIPENVFIIGTMNDIDRSVDSFDFAMRRRFRFIEIKANDSTNMLDSLQDEKLKSEAIDRMKDLNQAIVEVEDLNENYQIGAAYFLKLKTSNFDKLWTDYLQPLLQEYIQGMYDEKNIMKNFARKYGYKKDPQGDVNEPSKN